MLFNERRNKNITGRVALVRINVLDDINILCDEKYDETAWIDVNESDRVSDDHTGRKSRLK